MIYDGNEVKIPYKKFGAIIGDGVVIGVNTSIYPARRIGENSSISAGCIIKDDVPSHSDVMVEQKLLITKHEDKE
jgi:serine acetyltransferase